MPQITEAQLRQIEQSLLGRVNLRPRSITEDKLAVGAASAAIVRDGSISDIHIDNLTVAALTGGTISGETIIVASGGTIQSANYDPGVAGWAIFADGSAEFQNVTVRGVLDAEVGSDISGTYVSDGDLSATLDLTTAGSLSANYVAGVSGWAIDGNGSAEFNDVTVRGSIAGGSTIDIGGADASSFHVDASGNMWTGAALYADALFRVSAGGDARAATIAISDQSTYFGSLTGSSSYVQLNSDDNIGLVAGGLLDPTAQVLITANCDMYLDGALRLFWQDGSSTEATTVQFYGTSTGGGRLGYMGYASNDDLRLWNEAAAGLIYMATNDTERVRIHADGRMSFNNTLTGDIHYDFWGGYDNIATLRVWNRTPVADTPRGIDIYLGLDNTSNPGNGDTFVRFRRGDGNVRGSIDGNGASGVRFNTSSDEALKENISADLSEGVEAFDQIPWRTFTWKGEERPAVGVVAQQLAKVPRWASSVARGGTAWEVDPETRKKKRVRTDWGVDYVPFIGAIAAKLVDVDRRLRALESRDG